MVVARYLSIPRHPFPSPFLPLCCSVLFSPSFYSSILCAMENECPQKVHCEREKKIGRERGWVLYSGWGVQRTQSVSLCGHEKWVHRLQSAGHLSPILGRRPTLIINFTYNCEILERFNYYVFSFRGYDIIHPVLFYLLDVTHIINRSIFLST